MATAIRKFPFVERDIAVVVEKTTTWGDLALQIQKAAGPLLVNSVPFDLFEGGSLNPSQKSLAFRIRLQDPTRTLTDSDIQSTVEKIKSALQEHCGAHLR